MSQRDMLIDGLEFARRHERLSGRLNPESLKRLSDVLFDTDGSLDFAVSGEMAGSLAFLRLRIGGMLRLTCQRCLGPMDWPLDLSSRVILVAPGSAWPDDGQVGGLDDEACDAIEASRELDLLPLFEEEILLALPVAPRHEACKLPAAAADAGRVSPFAKLAGLRQK